MTKHKFWTLAFVAWLCVVWGHSLMSGSESAAESNGVVVLLRPLFEFLGVSDPLLMSFIVRKGAHFTEYVILCALGYRMAGEWFVAEPRMLCVSFMVWIVVPCIDECIQLFVPKRAGMPTDVLIDLCGGLVGLVGMRAYVARSKE